MSFGTAPTGVIDQFLHPPVGVLTNYLDGYGPYSGNQTLTQWSSTAGPVFTPQDVRITFGCFVQLNGTIPAGYGTVLGWNDSSGLYSEDVYENRLLQFVVQHQLLTTGAWVTTQIEDIHSFPHAILWNVALPGRIGLLVAPGLAFDLHYLVVG